MPYAFYSSLFPRHCRRDPRKIAGDRSATTVRSRGAKTWMHGVDFEAALEYSVKDFKRNFRAYYEAWLQN